MQFKSLSLTLQNIQSYFPYVFFYRVRQNFILKIPAFALKNVIYFLKKHTRAQYKSLIDLSAVDYMEKKFRFEIFYSLLSLKKNHRISISTTIYENKFIDSITTIFPTAN
jgi:NADH dehydrogenase (ubiquinone) Fe-S protein 3